MFKRLISFFIILSLMIGIGPARSAHAEGIALPTPGTMVGPSITFEPTLIKGITVNKDNPFLFDFVVDTGDNTDFHNDSTDIRLRQEADRLIKYFFACLTIPEHDLWVNLSPYEKNRIIPESLGQTALGRDLLAEDYILKQLTASLIYPEKDLGKEFWQRIYAKAQQLYGTTEIPVNTFNKVWILADKATVYEHGQTAFVVGGHLRVMLEGDYLALQKHSEKIVISDKIAPNIIRDLILPEIEREVNTGKNFATLRQIYNSLILATWYKKNLKEALLNQVYADKGIVHGINAKMDIESIYQRYILAYKKGVFNYIRNDPSIDGAGAPRKYFSGGFGVDPGMLNVVKYDSAMAVRASKAKGQFIKVRSLAKVSQPGIIDLPAFTDDGEPTDQPLKPKAPSPKATKAPSDSAMSDTPVYVKAILVRKGDSALEVPFLLRAIAEIKTKFKREKLGKWSLREALFVNEPEWPGWEVIDALRNEFDLKLVHQEAAVRRLSFNGVITQFLNIKPLSRWSFSYLSWRMDHWLAQQETYLLRIQNEAIKNMEFPVLKSKLPKPDAAMNYSKDQPLNPGVSVEVLGLKDFLYISSDSTRHEQFTKAMNQAGIWNITVSDNIVHAKNEIRGREDGFAAEKASLIEAVVLRINEHDPLDYRALIDQLTQQFPYLRIIVQAAPGAVLDKIYLERKAISVFGTTREDLHPMLVTLAEQFQSDSAMIRLTTKTIMVVEPNNVLRGSIDGHLGGHIDAPNVQAARARTKGADGFIVDLDGDLDSSTNSDEEDFIVELKRTRPGVPLVALTRFRGRYENFCAEHGIPLIYIPYKHHNNYILPLAQQFPDPKDEEDSANSAMLVPGGIDLNNEAMDMSVSKDPRGGVQINFDPAAVEQMKAQGILSMEPIIINITPLQDIRPLLGLTS